MFSSKEHIEAEISSLQRDIITDYLQSSNFHSLPDSSLFVDGFMQIEQDQFVVPIAQNILALKTHNLSLKEEVAHLQDLREREQAQLEENLRKIICEKNAILIEYEQCLRRDTFLREKVGGDCIEARVQQILSQKRNLEVALVAKERVLLQQQNEIKGLMEQRISYAKASAMSQETLAQMSEEREELLVLVEKLGNDLNELSAENKCLRAQNEEKTRRLQEASREINSKELSIMELHKDMDQLSKIHSLNLLELESLSNLKEQNSYLRDSIISLKECLAELRRNEHRLTESLVESDRSISCLSQQLNSLLQEAQESQNNVKSISQANIVLERKLTDMKSYEEEEKRKLRLEIELFREAEKQKLSKAEMEISKLMTEKCQLQEQLNRAKRERDDIRIKLQQQEEVEQELRLINEDIREDLKRTLQRNLQRKEIDMKLHRKSVFFLFQTVQAVKRLREEQLQLRTAAMRSLETMKLRFESMTNELVRQLMRQKQKCGACDHWAAYEAGKSNLRKETEDPEKSEYRRRGGKADVRNMKNALKLLAAQNQMAACRIKSLTQDA